MIKPIVTTTGEYQCPDCGSLMWSVEYAYGTPERYDGISEFRCQNTKCGLRIGRWSGKKLKEGQAEKPFGRPIPKDAE